MTSIVLAEKPYKPELGDLLCDITLMRADDPKPSDFFESKPKVVPKKLTREEVAKFKDNESLIAHLESHKLDGNVDFSKQLLPLAMVHPNPWEALDRLHIDAIGIKNATYECPYTKYICHTIVPVTLISDNLAEKYADVEHWSKEYLFDHEFTKYMHKDYVLKIGEIGRLLLGSGWTSGTRVNDGSRSEIALTVRLSNGDQLLVHTWEWFNK